MNYLSNLDLTRFLNLKKYILSLCVVLLTIFSAKLATTFIFNTYGVNPTNLIKDEIAFNTSSIDFYSYFSIQVPIVEVVAQPQSSVVKVTNQEFALKDFILKATYIEEGNTFIMVYNKGKNHFIKLDEVFEGYKLVEVQSEKSKFTKDGNIYWLFADIKKQASFEEDLKATPVAVAPKEEPKAQPLVVAKKTDTPIKFKDGKYFIPKKVVKEFSDIGKIFRSISIVPHYYNGKLGGFFVQNVVVGSIFDQLGLKARDKIIEVNYKPLTSLEDGFFYYNKLSTMENMTITVLRNEQREEIKYEIF